MDSKEKQQRANRINNDIEKLKNVLQDDSSPIRKMYLEPGAKKELFLTWANDLEELWRLGFYPDPLNTISNTIRQELKTLKLERAIPYIYDVLPRKYKASSSGSLDEESGSVGNPTENSSKDYSEENNKLILLLNDSISVQKLMITKLQSMPFVSKLIEQNYRHEFEQQLLQWKTALEFARQTFDNRQSVPTIVQMLLAYCVAAETVNYGSGLFTERVKLFGAAKSKKAMELLNRIKKLEDKIDNQTITDKETKEFRKLKLKSGDLTTKQSTKILKGEIDRVLAIFDPRTRDEAVFMGFYGIDCPDCGSFRVELKYYPGEKHEPGSDKLHCFNCDNKFSRISLTKCPNCFIPLTYDELEKIRQNSNYCQCGERIHATKMMNLCKL